MHRQNRVQWDFMTNKNILWLTWDNHFYGQQRHTYTKFKFVYNLTIVITLGITKMYKKE